MEIRAVLFDLDGTLVDSERESAEAMARVIERDLGVRVSQAARDYVVGHSWNEIYDFLRAEMAGTLTLPQQELIDRSAAERVHVIAEMGMTVMPGAHAAVKRVCEGRPRAIVTGSSRAEAAQSLKFLGVTELFQAVIASEDYEHGKPSPDAYLMAAKRLGVPATECLVIEDSAAGIAAGRAAGATVIAVRAGNFLRQDQSAAHVIVDTLDEITPALLEKAS